MFTAAVGTWAQSPLKAVLKAIDVGSGLTPGFQNTLQFENSVQLSYLICIAPLWSLLSYMTGTLAILKHLTAHLTRI